VGVLLDRVIHPNPANPEWPELVQELTGRLREATFPATGASSRMLFPVLFTGMTRR
jgi:hypothetical protein